MRAQLNKSQNQDNFTTLLKIEKKLKEQPTDDKVEFEITYFEVKDKELIRNSKITLTLGQMLVTQMLCRKFLIDSFNEWGVLNKN